MTRRADGTESSKHELVNRLHEAAKLQPGLPAEQQRLSYLATDRAQLDERIRDQVKIVLDLGGSWTTVGVALGVTRQAAQQRYGRG